MLSSYGDINGLRELLYEFYSRSSLGVVVHMFDVREIFPSNAHATKLVNDCLPTDSVE